MTREEWLGKVAAKMAPWFKGLKAPLPPVRASIGFPSTGCRARRIGECWDKSASADGTCEIFIRPDLIDPVEVAATLAHELAHAALGRDEKHGKEFARVVRALGLIGNVTATGPGPEFVARIKPVLAKVGPMPGAKLDFSQPSSARKKQTTRLLKAECPTCGYTVRVTQKWVDSVGAPHCPAHGEMEMK